VLQEAVAALGRACARAGEEAEVRGGGNRRVSFFRFTGFRMKSRSCYGFVQWWV
jgi:hypothetical protein